MRRFRGGSFPLRLIGASLFLGPGDLRCLVFLGQWWEESVFEKHRAPHRWPTTARSKTARDTAPRPGPIHDRKRPRPGTQDTRARPTRSTEQQDEQPETHSQNRPRRARQSSSPPPEQPRAPPSTGQDTPPCRLPAPPPSTRFLHYR